jgi:hypothetical protein
MKTLRMMNTPKKHAGLAPVTSIWLLQDGFHVMVVGYQGRRTVKKKANPRRKEGEAVVGLPLPSINPHPPGIRLNH